MRITASLQRVSDGNEFWFLQILACVIYVAKPFTTHSLVCHCTSTVPSWLVESSLHIADNGVCVSDFLIDYNLAMDILE
jgi:hypothetical protein